MTPTVFLGGSSAELRMKTGELETNSCAETAMAYFGTTAAAAGVDVATYSSGACELCLPALLRILTFPGLSVGAEWFRQLHRSWHRQWSHGNHQTKGQVSPLQKHCNRFEPNLILNQRLIWNSFRVRPMLLSRSWLFNKLARIFC